MYCFWWLGLFAWVGWFFRGFGWEGMPVGVPSSAVMRVGMLDAASN